MSAQMTGTMAKLLLALYDDHATNGYNVGETCEQRTRRICR